MHRAHCPIANSQQLLGLEVVVAEAARMQPAQDLYQRLHGGAAQRAVPGKARRGAVAAVVQAVQDGGASVVKNQAQLRWREHHVAQRRHGGMAQPAVCVNLGVDLEAAGKGRRVRVARLHTRPCGAGSGHKQFGQGPGWRASLHASWRRPAHRVSHKLDAADGEGFHHEWLAIKGRTPDAGEAVGSRVQGLLPVIPRPARRFIGMISPKRTQKPRETATLPGLGRYGVKTSKAVVRELHSALKPGIILCVRLKRLFNAAWSLLMVVGMAGGAAVAADGDAGQRER